MNGSVLPKILQTADRYVGFGMTDVAGTGGFELNASRSALDLRDKFDSDLPDWHGTCAVQTSHGKFLYNAARAAAPDSAYVVMECYGERHIVDCLAYSGRRGPHIACRFYPISQFTAALSEVEKFVGTVLRVLWSSQTVRNAHMVNTSLSLAHRSKVWCLLCLESAIAPQTFSVHTPTNEVFGAVEEAVFRVERTLTEKGLLRNWNIACYMSTKQQSDRFNYSAPIAIDPVHGLATMRLLRVLGLDDAHLWHAIDRAGGAREHFNYAPHSPCLPMDDAVVLSACNFF